MTMPGTRPDSAASRRGGVNTLARCDSVAHSVAQATLSAHGKQSQCSCGPTAST